MRRCLVGTAPALVELGTLCLALASPACSSDVAGTPFNGGSNGAGGARDGGSLGGASGADGATATAHFTVQITPSAAIPTVGIVTWSVDVPIDSATILFGRDSSAFELTAPVDLTRSGYRTLLLGMKQATTYYVEVRAIGGATTYVSDVIPFETGYLPNGLPVFTVADQDAASLDAGGGFTLSCNGLGGGTSTAFVFDRDGDLVWALDLTSTAATACTRARMSYDGQYLWAGNFANDSTEGALYRTTMDGLGPAATWQLPGRSHDFAVLPNGHALFFARDDGGGPIGMTEGADSIEELDPDTGLVTKIYDEATDFAALIDAAHGAHTDQVNYVPALQAISFSMRYIDTIGLVSYPAGTLLATFGGAQTDFAAMTWTVQHGHQVLADHLWVFNNTNGPRAQVLGFATDLAAKSATPTLDYDAGITCSSFGDVAELPNGNLYVTYSDTGVFQEISSTGRLLREVTTTRTVGYSEHRASLYGAPPPFDM
jgi:hypothetical protein